MRTDAVFFKLFESLPETFFLAIGEPAETAADYTFAAQEYKDTSLRTDGVFVPNRPGLPAYFVEVQFYRKPEIYADLLLKVARYLKYRSAGQAYRGVVLFATRALEPRELEPYRPLLESGYLRAIYLDEMPEIPGAPLGLATLQLIRQSETEAPVNARALIARVKDQIGDEAARRELVELIETVVLYKLPKLSREEIEHMLQVDDIRETKVYQEALAEGEIEGEMNAKVRAIARMHAQRMSASLIAEILELPLEVVVAEIAKLA